MATGPDGADLHELLLELVRSVGLLQVADVGRVGRLSLSEAFALHELDDGQGLAQQDIATRLRLDKSTVSRLVVGLEARGLLVRERDPNNRRIVRLSLTDAGREVHQAVARAMQARQRHVLAAMTASERTALALGLGGFLRGLHQPSDDPVRDRADLPAGS